jgi:mannose-1-phosphate guanylyltransferase/phosphomannomutase
MLKRAFIAGLNSGGANVLDLEVASVPVTRFHSRSAQSNGAVSLRLVEEDSDSIVIRFFDGFGADISEASQRKIERLFGREDFRRVRAADIGEIQLLPRAFEDYALSLERTVDVKAIKARQFKLVLDYAFGSSSFAMPNVLSKLGAEALAVNPFVSTPGVLGYDRAAHATELAEYVRTSAADLGAVIDPSGDQLTLIDNRGTVLDHIQQLLLLLELVAPELRDLEVALPVNAPNAAVEIVERAGASVRWCATSAPALMAQAESDVVGFAANLEGGVILPKNMPAFDAAAGLLKVLDVMAKRPGKLSEIVESLPHPHMTSETVVTPWDDKGTVMRTLVEQTQGNEVELLDGVKVFRDGGWVLILPDPEEPLTRVWAEATSMTGATQLVQEYVRRIRQMIR